MSRQISAKTRALVWARDGGLCLRCLAPGTNIHHRRARGMGGTSRAAINDPRNLVLLCGSGTTGCHGWIESNRAVAREQAWLLEDLTEGELARPVTDVFGVAWALRSDGSRQRATEMKRGGVPGAPRGDGATG